MHGRFSFSLRESFSLDGPWLLAFDPNDRGVALGWPQGLPPSAEAVAGAVPSVWNLVRPGYEGVAFYQRDFEANPTWRGRAVRLHVGAANYATQVWLNGQPVGAHEGGYTPFWFPVGDHLRYGRPNRLVVRVVDPPMEGSVDGLNLRQVACSKETWYYRYGGLWGSVRIEVSAPVWVEDLFVFGYGTSATVRAAVRNDSGRPASARVRATVLDETGQEVATRAWTLELGPGHQHVEEALAIANARSWSPERPVLYRARLALATEGASGDQHEVEFGLREVGFAGGRLLLDGRPVPIRGVLYQPSFPATLVYPPDPDLPARELRLIKDAGFNLIRFHLRPPPPGYLALADRLGLLVYEETALAWIAEGPRLRERCCQELEATLRRDRNHPSVVLWGVFNENQTAARLVGRELLSLARELDPSRPVVDNSGGAGAIDPGGAWAEETLVLAPGDAEPAPLADLHCYFPSPLPPAAEAWLAGETAEWHPEGSGAPSGAPALLDCGLGSPGVLQRVQQHLARPVRVFISEFGYGGLPDFARVLARFAPWPANLVDRVEQQCYHRLLVEGLQARGLDRHFGGVDGLIQAAQRVQAAGNRRQIEALRRNGRVGGYVVTQFQDAAWEMGAGLVDLWREPKAAYFEVAAANAPVLLVLRAEPAVVRPGEVVTVQAALLVDPPVRRPAAPTRITVETRAPDQGITHASGLLDPERSAFQAIAALPAREPGVYYLRAEMEGLAGQAEVRVFVVPTVDLEALGQRLWLVGSSPDAPRPLAALPSEPLADRAALVLDPDRLEGGQLDDLLRWVSQGGRALFLEMGASGGRLLSAALGRPLGIHQSLGLFVGCFHYLRDEELRRDLPVGRLMGDPFGGLLPRASLDEIGEVLAGALTSEPSAAGRPGWAWWADVQRISMGAGQVLLCQYRLRQRLGVDPLADVLFRNLVRRLLG